MRVREEARFDPLLDALEQRARILSLEPAEHVYSLGGLRPPSVTTVIGQTIPDPKQHDVYERFVGEEYAERGDRIHKAISWAASGNRELALTMLAHEDELMFAAWERFMAETGFVLLLAEQLVCGPGLDWAGCMDGLGYFPTPRGRGKETGEKLLRKWRLTPDRLVVVDWKSGWQAKWHRLQTAAYAMGVLAPAMEDRTLCKSVGELQRVAVYLRGGKWHLSPHNNREDLQTFGAAVEVLKFRRGRNYAA